MPIRWNKLLIILFFSVVTASFSQEKNPTVYPYGGVPDSSRFESWFERVPLNFKKTDFGEVKFDSLADFGEAQFDSLADFRGTKFNNLADFGGAQFNSLAFFPAAQFDSLANFKFALFDIGIWFLLGYYC